MTTMISPEPSAGGTPLPADAPAPVVEASASTTPTTEDAERSALARAIVAEYQSYIRHFRCATAERLGRQGVSMAHLHVLWLLLEHGDLPMGRLAELLDVSLSNATGLVDRMEERSLVERVRVPDDRRLVLVRPTSQGVQVVEDMDVFKRDLFEQVLERLDVEQLQRLHRAVIDLSAALPQPEACPPTTD